MLHRLLLSMFLIYTACSQSVTNCVHRNYGHGSTVCVCNANECDTLAPVKKTTLGEYTLYISSKDGHRFTKRNGTFSKTSTSNYANHTVYINREHEYQKIFGFGGAFTDSTGVNILSLSNATRHRLIRAYFSDDGLQYSMGRIPMAGTDFSSHFYTYDDVEDDYDLKHWALQHEDYTLKIPLIHVAQKLTNYDIKFFGSAWTAPTWMKTNNYYTGIGFLNISMFAPWANYYYKFIDAYNRHNVSIWGVTAGNEPADGFYNILNINDMGWVPQLQAQWIAENLGPRIRLGQYPDVKIMIVDDQRQFFPWVPRAIMQYYEAEQYIDGSAVHFYFDKFVSPNVLSITHYDYPDKFILATEACSGSGGVKNKVILGSWERAEDYLSSIIDDLNNWATGWMDWNMALNPQGGPTYVGNNVDSPIIVNKTADEFLKQPMFYAMGHFSKFIRPDSVRIHHMSTSPNLSITVFKRPDNGTVVEIFNPTNKIQPLTLVDQNLDYEKSFHIPKRSINTLIYW